MRATGGADGLHAVTAAGVGDPHTVTVGRTVKPYAAAAGAAVGAWFLLPVPLIVVLLLVASFVWRPNAVLTFAALACLTGFLGARAAAGMTLPATDTINGWVLLLDDPRTPESGGVRFTVRYMGKHLEARAHGAVAGRFGDALAGERFHVTGVVKAVSGDWQRWRHIVGRLTVQSVNGRASAAPLPAFANSVRRLLARGARGLSDEDRALFSGMVYGDDRDQSARLADDFRAAGLGHLLVVSGQNVAFVLLLVAPLGYRLRPGVRLVLLLCVLGVFAMLTRFEPSVLRAVTMAAVAVTSAVLGRPEQGRGILAWAIAVVLVIDPFVVRMLAFQLSVCATAGLLWIAPSLEQALPGPRPLRLALAVTAGAQLAVLPLLIIAFDTVPLASLPANLLAGPASGPVMMWGLTAGFIAGLAGGWVAWLVHLPTSVLLWWVRFVAAGAAAAPPAVVGAVGSAVVAAGTVIVLGARWISQRRFSVYAAGQFDGAFGGAGQSSGAVDGAVGQFGGVVGGAGQFGGVVGQSGGAAGFDSVTPSQREGVIPPPREEAWITAVRMLGVGIVVAALVYSIASAAALPHGWSTVHGASVFNHDTAVVVVLDRPGPPRRLLESLRMSGVRRVDLIVAADGGASDAHAVLALLERYQGAVVVAPQMHRVPRARAVVMGTAVNLGAVQVLVVADDPRLEVRVRRRSVAPPLTPIGQRGQKT